MGEAELIANTPSPRTRASLAADLRELGLAAGAIVIVHSSLKSLGWVAGGPVAVVQALMDVVTPAGTIVMPSQTGGYSDPAGWQNPPVPPDWVPILHESMPAFDPRIAPTRFMGQIAELFRTWPGVMRSNHPNVSFTAWGREAPEIVVDHTLDYGLGEGSPLARIYERGGWVLLIGVGYDRNTSFHLAEYRAGGSEETESAAPILVDGQRAWKSYRNIEYHDELFPELGAALEQTGKVRVGTVGSAVTRFFPQQEAIDLAVDWLRARRHDPTSHL